MPELPEVETVVQDLLKAGLVGTKIVAVTVFWARTITDGIPVQSLIGQSFTSIERRGKYLVFALSSGAYLLVHLRMTGRFLLGDATSKPLSSERVQIRLDDGRELKYCDTRKFGRWHLVHDPKEVLGSLGPEPLGDSFSVEYLENLCSKSRMLKPLLLDQKLIAGLGNIYVDEALWTACLHPEQAANSLTKQQIKKLHAAIKVVLERGLKTAGTTLGSGQTNFYRLDGSRGTHQEQLNIFRRTGQPCPRCKTPIVRLVVAQRSTHICPLCQNLM